MVPEWQEAYMDYHFLKTFLKEVQRVKQKNERSPSTSVRLQRKLTLLRTFSGLTQRLNHSMSSSSPTDPEAQEGLVDSAEPGGSEDGFEVMPADEGEMDLERLYFKRLDEEFDKVVQFYRSKVEEVMNEADLLNKQMDALIAFRVKVRSPEGFMESSVEMARLSLDIAASTTALSATTPSAARSSRN